MRNRWCIANRPLVLIRMNNKEDDTYELIENNCAYTLNSLDGLENTLNKAIFTNNEEQILNQKKYAEKMGITFDGKHHERVLNAIIKLGKK